MTHDEVERFGKRLMHDSYMRLLGHLRDLLDGAQYAGQPWYDARYAALASLDPAQRRAVEALIAEAAVSAQHAFLEMFHTDALTERGEGRLVLKIVAADGGEVDLAQASDGLPGELYSDEGWIARFGTTAGP